MKKLLIVCALLLLGACAKAPAAKPVPDPTATPAPTATAVPTPTATAVPTPTATPAPTPFSLVVLPDTQELVYFRPEEIVALRDWISSHREADNLVGVIHTGDLVDNGFKQWQWDNFYPLLEVFDEDLFFFPVAGNHDVSQEKVNFSGYLKQSFLSAIPEEQRYMGGKCLYRLLPVGEQELLMLGMGWHTWYDRDACAWAKGVMDAHPGTPCLLVVHGFLVSETKVYSQVETFIAQNPSIRLVLCGHKRDYYTRTFTYDDDGNGTMDRTVTAMMLNMQTKDYAFRVLTIDPLTHGIEVQTLLLDGSPAPDFPKLGPISFTLEKAF